MWIYMIIGFAALFAGWIFWRLGSVARGHRARTSWVNNELAPIIDKLVRGETLQPKELRPFLSRHELRGTLIRILQDQGLGELVPKDYDDLESRAKSSLSHWMLHPNEFGKAPVVIEFVCEETVKVKGRDCLFHVFYVQTNVRGQKQEAHGIVGPIDINAAPYEEEFPALVPFGNMQPNDLIKYYVDILEKL